MKLEISRRSVGQRESLERQTRSRRFFSKLMLKGKVNAAMRLLNETNSGGVLSLSDVVLEEQARKHLFLNLPMGQL